METRVAEPGGDARKLQRRAQELLAQVLAFGRVVAALVVGVFEIHRFVGLALIDEFRRQHAA